MEFLRVEPRIQSKPDALMAPRPIRDGFLFDKVSFPYPGSPRAVLDRLDVRLSAGEKIALIGENGQGKTTIVKLSPASTIPPKAAFCSTASTSANTDIEDLHSQIGVIFQDFVRYEMTARQNIAIGRLDLADEDAIRAAAGKSLADQVIARLPRGYDQLLGRRFEGGVDLSGGEWQKNRPRPRLPPRCPDPDPRRTHRLARCARSEYEVFQRFAELTQGKMALLISHRFSTVRMADRIIVLEGGRIAEQGTHNQLIQMRGRYNGMFELQASSYR